MFKKKVWGSSIGLSGHNSNNCKQMPSVSGSAGTKRGKAGRTSKGDSEEHDWISQKLHKAKRESFESQRTENAWRWLNRNSLVDLASAPSNFISSLYSTCSDPITVHMLIIILELFEIEEVTGEIEVTQGFMYSLFYEGTSTSPELQRLNVKR